MVLDPTLGKRIMPGCFMLQNRGKSRYQRLILRVYFKYLTKVLFLFDRLLMMVTLCLAGKERLQRGWKMIQDKKFFLIKNKWPDTMNAIEKNQNKLLLNYKCSSLSKRDLLLGSLTSDGPQKVVLFLPCPPKCSTIMGLLRVGHFCRSSPLVSPHKWVLFCQ